MKFRIRVAILWATLLVPSLMPGVFALEFRNIVIEEASKMIDGTGRRVFIVGSATSAKPNAYKCPLLAKHADAFSDVDMRFSGTSSTSMHLYEEYDDFYRELKRRIYTRLKNLNNIDDMTIARCMDSVNLYAPDELTGHLLKDGSKTSDDYVAALKKLHTSYGQGPFHHMNFGQDKPDLVSLKAYIQGYEETDGLMLYYSKDYGRVMKGITTLDDYGQALFTSKGLINTGFQFLDKSNYFLKLGSGKDVAKNLTRVRTNLLKAKRMSGFKANYVGNQFLDDALANLKKMTGSAKPTVAQANLWLEQNRALIEQAISSSGYEFVLCNEIANATPQQAAVMRNLLEKSKWRKLSDALRKMWKSSGGARQELGAAFQFVGKAVVWFTVAHEGYNTYSIYKKYADQGQTEKGLLVAYNNVLKVYAEIKLWPIAIAKLVCQAGLWEVEELGANIAISRQDCQDLLAGIIAVTGRENVGEGMQIDEAARKFIHSDNFVRYVAGKIQDASSRPTQNKSEMELESEAEIYQELTDKCMSNLVVRWQQERQDMLSRAVAEATALGMEIEYTPTMLMLETDPQPLNDNEAEVSILIGCNIDRRKAYQHLVDLQERIKDMGSEDRVGDLVALQDFYWTIDGKAMPVERTTLLLTDVKQDQFMGWGYAKKIKVPRTKTVDIQLLYRLYITGINTISPELMAYQNNIKRGYKLTANTRVEPAGAAVYIEGPEEVLVNEKQIYKAVVPVDLADDLNTRVSWNLSPKNGAGRTDLGDGLQREITIPTLNRYDLTATYEEMNGGGWSPRGNAVKEVVAHQAAQVTFRIIDNDTLQPVSNATVALRGMHRGGRTYSESAPRGRVTVDVLPNAYSYSVTAAGYEKYDANDTFTAEATEEVPLVPKPGQKKPAGAGAGAGLDREYVGITLDHDELTMAYDDTRYVKATAPYSHIPHFRFEDVTAKAVWKSSHPDIATAEQGVIKSKKQSGSAVITVEFTADDGQRFFAQCPVQVSDLDAAMPELDFIVSPDRRIYDVGDRLTFTPAIQGNPDDYQFVWFIGDSRYAMKTKSYTFEEPGRHTVRMLVIHRDSRNEDAIAKTITVGAPVEPEVKLSVNPEPPYASPAKLIFSAECAGMPEPPEIAWLVNDEEKQRSADETFEYTFKGKGKYKINCLVYVTEGGQRTQMIQTPTLFIMLDEGETAQPIARWINKFGEEKAGDKLHITSTYWREGDHGTGDWTDPARIDTFDMPVDHILTTGEQADGYNTGWFVWSNPDSGQLYYRVYKFNFARHLGRFAYNGLLDLKRKKYQEGTLKLLETKSRAITFQWDNTDGSRCKARIYKTPGSGRHDNNLFVQGGVEYLGCIELRTPEEDAQVPEADLAGYDIKADFGILIKKPDASTAHRIKLYIPPTAPPIYMVYDGANKQLFTREQFISCAPNGYPQHEKAEGPSAKYAYWMNYGTHYLGHVRHWNYDDVNYMFVTLYHPGGRIFIDDKSRFMTQASEHPGGRQMAYEGDGYEPYKEGGASPYAGNRKQPPRLEELKYKNSIWPVRLQDGVLEVRGCGYPGYRWRESWKTVGMRVVDFAGSACGRGPVIAYRQEGSDHYKLVTFNYENGDRKELGILKGGPRFHSEGPYGLIVSAMEPTGKQSMLFTCYEYSHNRFMKIECPASARQEFMDSFK